jgi:hypothetical protein
MHLGSGYDYAIISIGYEAFGGALKTTIRRDKHRLSTRIRWATKLIEPGGYGLPHRHRIPLAGDRSGSNPLGYVSGCAVAVVSLDLHRDSPELVFGRHAAL